jgi:hypothetical protein
MVQYRFQRKAAVLAVVLGGAVAMTSAFGGSNEPRGNVVTVVASDYAFQVADTIPAGLTTLRLVNKGPDLHHIYMVRFAAGKSLSDLAEFMKANPHGPAPTWVSDVGGPNTPVPGAESNATLMLAPGRYAMLCVIPAMKDGQPHVMKGMMKEIIVVPARGVPVAGREEFEPAITMTLSDYDFTISRPLLAGESTIRVRNNAVQSHEVLIVKLAPGKTPADFVAFVEKPEGAPPGMPVGGTTFIAQGGWNDITLPLEKGDYALICFVPDSKDGKPHFVHGMMKQVKVN